MKFYENKEQVIDKICDAYADSLMVRHLRHVVIIDGETKQAYLWTDVAGGNSEPESVFNGTDAYVCEFCFANWDPEDTDENFRENLLSYCSAEEIARVLYWEQQNGELFDLSKLKLMFENAYEQYCDTVYENYMCDFEPEMYLEAFEREQEELALAYTE